jgi:dihydroorotase
LDLLPTGVTQAVDAGSAGGHLFEAFRRYVIDVSKVRIKAFVNIASIGTTSIYLQGELKSPNYVNVDLAVKTIQEHSDVAIGIKVRASHDVGGEFADEALIKARAAADKAGVPLMVHLGPAPATIDTILETLGSGDILTHCHTGWNGNTLLDEGGKPRKSVVSAISRGVKFDVGHGAGGFDSTVAAAMIRKGYLPDAISTDLHAGSIGKVQSLPKVMSKFLALGMSLDEVFARSTVYPAKLGYFEPPNSEFQDGEKATFTIFELREGKFSFSDVHGHDFEGNQMIEPVFSIHQGVVTLDVLEENKI